MKVKIIRRTTFLTLLLSLFVFISYSQTEITKDTDIFSENVTNSAEVDKIEILAVKGISFNVKDVDCTKPEIICTIDAVEILDSKTLTSDDAKKLSELWRKLKNGNGAGCFAPGYVLKFYKDDKVILTSDVCFHCCNIALPGRSIRSICRDKKAFEVFKDFIKTNLPHPKTK